MPTYIVICTKERILCNEMFRHFVSSGARFETWDEFFKGKVYPISTVFQLIGYIRKPEYPIQTADLPQITDKLYHIMLYRVHDYVNIIYLTVYYSEDYFIKKMSNMHEIIIIIRQLFQVWQKHTIFKAFIIKLSHTIAHGTRGIKHKIQWILVISMNDE